MTGDACVLVVDDSALMRKVIKEILTVAGFEVCTARSGADALDVLGRVNPDVVTLDINMPEMDGLSCLAEIMRRHPTPVVMVSSLTERNAKATMEALALGAVDFVQKPGGTVSLNLDQVATKIVSKVRCATRAKVRAGGLAARLRAQHRAIVAADSGGGSGRNNVDLVLVGASTGGPPLLTMLVSELPPDFPAAVVIAQHMPASFTAALAKRLNEIGPLPTQEVTRPCPVRPGQVYLGHGDADVVLARRDGALIVKSVPASANYRWHPSVDRMVASARSVVPAERMVGGLLTGMGYDGAKEMAALHGEGGRTIAESEETAVVWGMPGELAQQAGATCVLPAEKITRQIRGWVC
jgi:two-component system chemotaxis response regulator CheB